MRWSAIPVDWIRIRAALVNRCRHYQDPERPVPILSTWLEHVHLADNYCNPENRIQCRISRAKDRRNACACALNIHETTGDIRVPSAGAPAADGKRIRGANRNGEDRCGTVTLVDHATGPPFSPPTSATGRRACRHEGCRRGVPDCHPDCRAIDHVFRQRHLGCPPAGRSRADAREFQPSCGASCRRGRHDRRGGLGLGSGTVRHCLAISQHGRRTPPADHRQPDGGLGTWRDEESKVGRQQQRHVRNLFQRLLDAVDSARVCWAVGDQIVLELAMHNPDEVVKGVSTAAE